MIEIKCRECRQSAAKLILFNEIITMTAEGRHYLLTKLSSRRDFLDLYFEFIFKLVSSNVLFLIFFLNTPVIKK